VGKERGGSGVEEEKGRRREKENKPKKELGGN